MPTDAMMSRKHGSPEAAAERGVRVVVCGSFRREQDRLRTDFMELREAGARVLSPVDVSFVEEVDGFVVAAHERGDSPKLIQSRHLSALQQAEMVWLHCPGGYVGPSGALELGIAHTFGIPVYAREAPDDITLRHFATVVSGPRDAVSLALEVEAQMPARPLAALQRYYRQVATERGYDSESARDTLLLLTEEVGELARAIRKGLGLVRHGAYARHGIGAEVADVQLYLLHLANILGVDLAEAVAAKERVNAARFTAERRAAAA